MCKKRQFLCRKKSAMTTCFLCTNPPVGKCDSCDFGEYCSQEHYEVHKTKDGFCQPFRMRYKKGMGRCLETTRNVKAFEMVLQDTWGIWGTDNNSPTYCLACLANVEDITSTCSECNIPMCDNVECRNSEIHQLECEILRNHKPEKLVVKNGHPVYALIAPLRIFRFKKDASNGQMEATRKFEDIMSLESHLEERRRDQDRWDWVRYEVLPILKRCSLTEEDIEIIEKILAIIRTNCVGLLPKLEHCGVSRGYALFPYFSIINHSCIANCRYIVGLDNTTMSVRAMRPISKGDEVTIQYLGAMLGNSARKKSLEKQWKFTCNCNRCLDPTEFGSYLQAIKCKLCIDKQETGYMLPSYQTTNPNYDIKVS